MKIKKFLPNKRTVIACVLIVVLLVSTSVGMGYSKFANMTTPYSVSYQVKNYGFPADRYVVLRKDTANSGSYRFDSPDGNVIVTYSKASANATYQSAEYLVAHFDPQIVTTDYTRNNKQIRYQYEIGIDYINYQQQLVHDLALLQSETNGGASGGIVVYIAYPQDTDKTRFSYEASYTVPEIPTFNAGENRIGFGNIKCLGGRDEYNKLTHAIFALNLDKTSWADYADTEWYDTDPDDPEYWISNASELAGLAKLVNNGMSFAGKTIYLTNDIDLSDADGFLRRWIPIGSTSDHPFRGSFDGQNHTIYGLNVPDFDFTYRSTTDVGAGLFGYVSGSGSSELKDLVIDTAYLAVQIVDNQATTMGAIGTLAGFAGDCDISGITVINSNMCGAAVSGGYIVGYCKDNTASFTDCYFSGCSFTSDMFTCRGGNYGYRKSDESSAPIPVEAPAQPANNVATPDQP